ncbi:MAG: hypothetical protein V4732_17660 [Pseudomonadota bacterium]
MNIPKLKFSVFFLVACLIAAILFLQKPHQQLQITEDVSQHQTEILNQSTPVVSESNPSTLSEKTTSLMQLTTAQKNIGLESRYQQLSDNENYPTLESRVAAMNDRNKKTYEPEAVLDAMATPSIWAQTTLPPKNMHLNENELNDGREFVAINRLKIESLMPGDSLPLPVAQMHAEFDINIVSVDENPNGSFTWHGEIKRDNEIYFVDITQSEKLTLAGLSTPNGNFALQANGDEGWLAATDTLFKRNENISDALIPHEHDLAPNDPGQNGKDAQ